jgi:hypothetical protein
VQEIIAVMRRAALRFEFEDIEDASLAALSADPDRVLGAAESGETSYFQRMCASVPVLAQSEKPVTRDGCRVVLPSHIHRNPGMQRWRPGLGGQVAIESRAAPLQLGFPSPYGFLIGLSKDRGDLAAGNVFPAAADRRLETAGGVVFAAANRG